MKLIQKGNRQLRVDDVRAAELIKAGYVEIDRETGKPIVVETEAQKAEKALRLEHEALLQENETLKQENEQLKAEIAKLTEKPKKGTEGKKAE